MDKSSAMTIEFLRARLLSERSVSKSARQRADELAKRVAELEEQLNFVSLQRKKAEKATADVLAILENHGISDVSGEFDSNSEHDEVPHDCKSDNGTLMTKEASANMKMKMKSDEAEAYSSSEIESSPSTGRSLSWKSTKDSQHSFEKKKYIESVRRRASFPSNNSSARRVGKSCRRIRRRETRSMEELQNDGNERAMCSADVSNCSDNGSVAVREGSGLDNGKGQLESTELGADSETQKENGHYYSGHERDEDMESALQHQAQLINQYEEEEKAQREWEEKFRESYNGVQISRSLPTPTDANNERSLDKKCNDVVESSPSEFSFPLTKEKRVQQSSAKQDEVCELTSQQCPLPHVTTPWISTAPHAMPSSSPSLELSVVPQETKDNLEPILEALQQAKLSLNQRLRCLTPVTREASVNTIRFSDSDTHYMDRLNVPLVSPGLFRLPTDTRIEETAQTNPGTQLSHVNYFPGTASSRSLSEHHVPSTSPFSSDLFHTTLYRSFTPEFNPGAPPLRSFSQPRLSEGSPSFYRLNHVLTNALVEDTYPYVPDVTLRLPLNDEGPSRTFPSSESGLPPPGARLISYNDNFRPNMPYR